MAEILKNTYSAVYHQVFWKGNAIDADGLPNVKVYDISTDPEQEDPGLSQLLTTLVSEKDETNIGSYAVYIPLSISSSNKTLRLIWEYSAQGQSVAYEHDVFIVTPYADIYQAANYLNISTDLSDPNNKTYNELVGAERYARQIVEKYTGQVFGLYKDIHRILGSDSDILPLPDRIQTFEKLYMNDILLVDNTANPIINNWNYNIQISETNFAIRINRASMLDNTVYTANGMVPPTIHDGSGIFRNGVMYEVHGTFGWKKVPDRVELATIELMKDFFSKDIAWKNQYVQKIQTFDWQFEYLPEVFSGTGNAYADRLLSDYVVSQVSII